MARRKGDVPVASIKEWQVNKARIRVLTAADDYNERVFGRLASTGNMVISSSEAPHAPCTELSVVVEHEGARAIVGIVIDGPGAEDAPVVIMSLPADGGMPRVCSVQAP